MDIHDFNPSRRRFLSGMLAVGAASALAPNPLISKVWAAGENPEQWIQSGSHYGAFEAKVVNGEWTETRPFKHDKYPCDMLNAVREVVYNPSRVRYPMVRLTGCLNVRSRIAASAEITVLYGSVGIRRWICCTKSWSGCKKPMVHQAYLPGLLTGKW